MKQSNGRQRLSWPQTAMNLAHDIARYRSEDPYVQVGAVIIKHNKEVILGYNGAPPGVNINWSDRDKRRIRVIHAEANALDNIRFGEAWVMAVTALPCDRCIVTAAQKGVTQIYYSEELPGYDHALTKQLANEFGILLTHLPYVRS